MINKLIHKVRNFVEHRRMLSFYKELDSSKMFFVVSTGRTGTNFLEQFLASASKNVFCKHEPQPDLFGISINKIRSKVPQKSILAQIMSARYSILKEFTQSSKTLYIESNPFASMLVEEIQILFPQAKFIFIHRDVKSYLLSALNKAPQGDGNNNFYSDNDHRKRLGADDFEGDKYASRWNGFSRAERIVWNWNKCNQHLLQHSTANAKSWARNGFEQLFSKEHLVKKEAWTEFLSFLSIKLTNEELENLLLKSGEKRNQTKEKHIDSLGDLDKNERTLISEMTQDMRKNLGYSEQLILD